MMGIYWFYGWSKAVECVARLSSHIIGKAKVEHGNGPHGESWRLTFVRDAS